MTPDAGTTGAELLAELGQATAQFFTTEKEASAANREHTNSANRLNEAQRKVDAFFNKLKKESPGGSEWKREEERARNRSSE